MLIAQIDLRERAEDGVLLFRSADSGPCLECSVTEERCDLGQLDQRSFKSCNPSLLLQRIAYDCSIRRLNRDISQTLRVWTGLEMKMKCLCIGFLQSFHTVPVINTHRLHKRHTGCVPKPADGLRSQHTILAFIAEMHLYLLLTCFMLYIIVNQSVESYECLKWFLHDIIYLLLQHILSRLHALYFVED